MNMDLRKNSDGTCNCRPFNGGCFYISSYGGPCDCECHKPEPAPWKERWKNALQYIKDAGFEADYEAMDMIESFISQELESAKKQAREEVVREIEEIMMNFQMSPEGRLRLISDLLKSKE